LECFRGYAALKGKSKENWFFCDYYREKSVFIFLKPHNIGEHLKLPNMLGLWQPNLEWSINEKIALLIGR